MKWRTIRKNRRTAVDKISIEYLEKGGLSKQTEVLGWDWEENCEIACTNNSHVL